MRLLLCLNIRLQIMLFLMFATVLISLMRSHDSFAVDAVGSMKVEVKTIGSVPETGDLKLSITVADDAGVPLDFDKIELLAYMPAMGTMPYMESPGDIERKGVGLYHGLVELTMGGSWEITLTLVKNSQERIYRYSVTGGIPGILDRNRSSSAGFNAAAIDLDPPRIQRLGVRFGTAERSRLTRLVRSVGVVEADASRRAEVSVRFSGYLRRLERIRQGDGVKVGQILAYIDSPELLAAQEEFLISLRLSGGSLHMAAPAAEERLRNLGVALQDISRLRRIGTPISLLPVRSPIAGTVLDANVREGQQILAGQVMFVVGDLDNADVVARVFHRDVLDIRVGDVAKIRIPTTGERLSGTVTLIAPTVGLGSGTVDVRIRPKEASKLRPGLAVEVSMDTVYPESLLIPSEAILYSGRYRYVFVEKNQGSVVPVEVTVGRAADGKTEILEGLDEGERVVASGTFLLGSEANLRSALPKWRSAEEERP